MESISGLVFGAAQPLTASAGVKESPKVQRPEKETEGWRRRPATDEYIPEEKQGPTGRYWLDKGEGGQPRIHFDSAEKAADDPQKPNNVSDDPNQDQQAEDPAPANSGSKAESCTGSTDKVDREIEKLKKEKEELEQQINSETDDIKIEELEKKLTRVERELHQKDNDAYRRQHTIFF